jgi:fatty acid desaturase
MGNTGSGVDQDDAASRGSRRSTRTGARQRDRRGFPSDWLTKEEQSALKKSSYAIGIGHFVVDWLLYLTGISVALAPLPLSLSLVVAILTGFLFLGGRLFTLGHDASHMVLTPSGTLN